METFGVSSIINFVESAFESQESVNFYLILTVFNQLLS